MSDESSSNKKSQQDDAFSSSSALPLFPRGNTAAEACFPYDTPYPQQVDLMDCLLQSLELAAANNSNDSSKQQQQCCPVYMLESPTGTGKSLSLACAALTWLRHVEQQDLKHPDNSNTPSPATTTTGVDWLDDWVSPEQQQAQLTAVQVRQTAAASRQALRTELQRLSRQWQQQRDDDASSSKAQRRTRVVRTAIIDAAVRAKSANANNNKRRRKHRNGNNIVTSSSSAAAVFDEFCLEDYHSDENNDTNKDEDDSENELSGQDRRRRRTFSNSTATTTHHDPKHLLDGAALDGSSVLADANKAATTTTTTAVGNVVAGSGVRKIIYAARTHSQLSQFVGELRRCCTHNDVVVRVVHLGSRKALCGNAAVNTKSSTEKAVTETCLDLQKGIVKSNNNKNSSSNKRKGDDDDKTTTTTGCPLLRNRETTIPTLAMHILAQPTDIEEAAALGSDCCCAYYASREAVAAAEVVVLPYSMLLSKQTRAAVGLSLQQNLVIVDEAHNLPEALRSLHSCRLSLPILQAALQQLQAYVARYADRLAGRNLYYLGQIRRILLALQKHLQTPPPGKRRREGMLTAAELLIERKLDNINLFRILRYLDRSRLSQKLLGFTNHKRKMDETNNEAAATVDDIDGLSKHVSAMSIVQTFLEKLTFSGKEGKIVTDWPTADDGGDLDSRSRGGVGGGVPHPTLRYVLLHPAAFFENVLDEAHALALVGGTLRPFVHVAAELLLGGINDENRGTVLQEAAKADSMTIGNTSSVSNSYVSPTFTAFTCDHVVPPSNVLLQCLAQGPTGQSLDFRFQSRSTNAVCDELGKSLVRICQTAPCGVVVFLPSYSYEAQLVRRWKQTSIWQELQAAKKVHREPKSSQHVESALKSYARDAVKVGAMLLSVIGGKMSEGINFSNDMARCVVVVGLPYPDVTDPELKEKMAALDASLDKTITGQAYYQNLCMRAVNQSVGRAIRHANDYAAIVLIDRRYTCESRIWSGLPTWLKKGNGSQWRRDLALDKRLEEMRSFFDSKK